jgi:hypothetical protein
MNEDDWQVVYYMKLFSLAFLGLLSDQNTTMEDMLKTLLNLLKYIVRTRSDGIKATIAELLHPLSRARM